MIFIIIFFKDEAPYEYQTKEYQTSYDDFYNQDVQQQEDAIDFLSQGLKDKQDLIGGMDVSRSFSFTISKVQFTLSNKCLQILTLALQI